MIGLIFRKEMREMMRDKRVFYGALVGPVFLIALLMSLIGMVERTFTKQQRTTVHVVSADPDLPLFKSLEASGKFTFKYVASEGEGKRLVEDGAARLVLLVPPDFGDRMRREEPITLSAILDGDDVRAQVTAARLQEAIAEQNKERVAMLLQRAGISAQMLMPVRIENRPIEKKEEGVGSTLAGFLPYLIVLWAFYGAMSIAADLVAGEKERQTLETLLITPVSRTQVALGKFWALVVIGFVSSMSSLVTVLVMGAASPTTAKVMFPSGFNLSIGTLAAMVGVVLPLVMMFSGILLALSAFARNTREAQTHLTMVSFLVLMPAIFSQFIGFTDFAKAKWVPFVPILNVATVLRDALLGNLNPSALGIAIAVSLVLAALTIAMAVRMFNREKVLARI